MATPLPPEHEAFVDWFVRYWRTRSPDARAAARTSKPTEPASSSYARPEIRLGPGPGDDED
jgi:hypothetical protein